MLTLSDIIYDIGSVLFTPCCYSCSKPLTDGQNFICTECRIDAPLTTYWLIRNNPMVQTLHSIEPRIDHASALFYIRKGSKWQDMVYKLKYWGGWRNGYDLGRWLGVELKASKLYNTVDLIVPVPLHPMRQVARGYNQSEFIARGIARSIGIEIDNSTLFRRHHISSQVNSSRMDRWLNMECMFGVKRSHKFEGRHILIVDDVCTTGATTLACAEAIFNSVKDVKISIATLATIDKNFGINLMMDDKL